MTRIRIDDAFIRGNADGSRWTIGTRGVALTLAAGDGHFALIALRGSGQTDTPRTVLQPPCAVDAAEIGAWQFTGAAVEKAV